MNLESYDYDTEFINNILEKIKNSVITIKNFIHPKKNVFEFYFKILNELNDISNMLKEYKILNYELKSFLRIKNKILNIVYNNCKDSSFGHCNFAIVLLEKFNELLNNKLYLLHDFTDDNLEEYNNYYKNYHDEMRNLDKIFYLDIFKPINDFFNEDNVYQIMKSL